MRAAGFARRARETVFTAGLSFGERNGRAARRVELWSECGLWTVDWWQVKGFRRTLGLTDDLQRNRGICMA